MPLRVSVVVPTHDTRALTARCLASLAGFGASEVVVVDDGSTDGTLAALSPLHPEAIWLRHERPAGFSGAANRGLREARGDLLLLLNSDTELRAGNAAALAAAFAGEPALGAAGARLFDPDGRPQWSGGPEPTLGWLFALASGLPAALGGSVLWRRLRPVSGAAPGPVGWLPGTALALRREAWAAVGPFEEERYGFYAQDLDLGSRLTAAGWTLRVLADFEVLHHLGGTIGRSEGAASGQRLDLLWRDLAAWAERRHGRAWARRARRALTLGGRFRAAALAAAALGGPPARRAALAAERHAVRAALAALRSGAVPASGATP